MCSNQLIDCVQTVSDSVLEVKFNEFAIICIFQKLYMECCPRWGEGGSKSGEKLSTWFMDGP